MPGQMWVRKITNTVAVLVVLVLSLVGTAAADDDVLGTWSPAEATGEQWKPPVERSVSGIAVSPTSVCTGNGYSWISTETPTRITLTRRTCPRGSLPLLVTNLPELFGRKFDPRIASALPNGDDRVALLPTGHVRSWLQDGRLVELTTECQSRNREDCLTLSAKAARHLAARLPGRPAAGLPNPGPLIQTAIKVGLIALVAILIVVSYRRRRRKVVRRGTIGDDRWTSVDTRPHIAP